MPDVLTPKAPKYERMLAKLLENRLRRSPDSPKLPIVIETAMPASGTVHLIVIWDDWRDMPGPRRSRIITEAYEAAHPLDHRGRAIIPLGLSAAEALSLGYLPYQIIPVVRKADRVSEHAVLDAMKSVGGVYTRIGAESQLRFATLAQAQEAYRALVKQLPGPFWTLVHDQSPAESA